MSDSATPTQAPATPQGPPATAPVLVAEYYPHRDGSTHARTLLARVDAAGLAWPVNQGRGPVPHGPGEPGRWATLDEHRAAAAAPASEN